MGHLSTSNRVDASKAIDNGTETTMYKDSKDILNKDNNIKPFDKNNNNDKKEDNFDIADNDITDAELEPITSKTHLNVYENWRGDELFGYMFDAPLKWEKIIQLFALHIVFIYCCVTHRFLYEQIGYTTGIFATFIGIFQGFGITGGAHRLWTHKAYKAKLPLRIILMILFTVSGQNSMYDWVRDHRVHHKYSETDCDPHNARRGFFFAHVGWLMMYKHPNVLRKGRQIDMSDIDADPVVQFHQKYFYVLKFLFAFIIPVLIPVYCWNEDWYWAIVDVNVIRYVLGLNFTWSVNSAAHLWGTRPYDQRINPSENLYVSLISMGEGWHNYHHVFPWDYKAAELGQYTVNGTTMLLDFFAKIGWAYDMKEPSKELVRKTIEKYGDGTHPSMADHHHLEEVPMPADDENYDENSNCCDKKD